MKRVDFIAIDEWLDDIAKRHWGALRPLGYALAVAGLFAGVAAQAWESGFARRAGLSCCADMPAFEILTSVAAGAAAVLFVFLYAKLTGTLQRVFVEPFTHVRPEPPPAFAARWAVFLHVVIGIVLFFWMASVREADGGYRADLEWIGTCGLMLGWWLGGRHALDLFWPKGVPKYFTRQNARAARRTYEAKLPR